MMGIINSVSGTIKRYGSSVEITYKDGRKIRTRAFVEPLRYKNRIYVGGEYHKLGLRQTEKYLYIGPPECAVGTDCTVIETQGHKYIVKRCETYYVTDNPVYIWAILAPYGEVLEDDYESD